ncbi:MAG: hypothetical protein J3K34DRAFT_424546 [Monoraphidium minutum]|nr:MAG: hypothetical protein J3K34DRAFT_424546 [Monoraphidium minutum]
MSAPSPCFMLMLAMTSLRILRFCACAPQRGGAAAGPFPGRTRHRRGGAPRQARTRRFARPGRRWPPVRDYRCVYA